MQLCQVHLELEPQWSRSGHRFTKKSSVYKLSSIFLHARIQCTCVSLNCCRLTAYFFFYRWVTTVIMLTILSLFRCAHTICDLQQELELPRHGGGYIIMISSFKLMIYEWFFLIQCIIRANWPERGQKVLNLIRLCQYSVLVDRLN